MEDPVLPSLPVELARQVLELQLALEVAPPLQWREPRPRLRRRHRERRRHRHLRLRAHRDVDLLRRFRTFPSTQVLSAPTAPTRKLFQVHRHRHGPQGFNTGNEAKHALLLFSPFPALNPARPPCRAVRQLAEWKCEASFSSLDAHDGLVEVVVHRQLEALPRLQVVRVVERLGVEQHAEAVCLPHLCKEQHA